MSRLNILWTTDNEATIISFLELYTVNSMKREWWDEIHIVIWGGSTKLIYESEKMQAVVKNMIENKIIVEACKHCCDRYNATEVLENLGVDVKYMGEPLTEYLKSGDSFFTL
ncbi:MAG: hypothetical protein PQJ49_08555 [Sphaerochaetaceae bacterium]|jgi:hypothetical protein|nr:hypothetical protein [Sphaerochaetaceae bacterium]MDC7249949.1 hypothetical protein [Sphaerochaetaceae bacterium]